MTWLSLISIAGNWTGYAHAFQRDSRRAVCGQYRFEGEEWKTAPQPNLLAVCRECRRVVKDGDRCVI